MNGLRVDVAGEPVLLERGRRLALVDDDAGLRVGAFDAPQAVAELLFIGGWRLVVLDGRSLRLDGQIVGPGAHPLVEGTRLDSASGSVATASSPHGTEPVERGRPRTAAAATPPLPAAIPSPAAPGLDGHGGPPGDGASAEPAVDVDLLLVRDGTEQQVRLRCAADVAVVELAAHLGTSGLWLGSAELPGSRFVADVGLTRGARVGVGRPAPQEARAPSGAVEVAVVGGRAAGRSLRVDAGRVRVGSAPGADLALAATSPAFTLTLDVAADGSATLVAAEPAVDVRCDGEPAGPGRALRPHAVLAVAGSLLSVRPAGQASARSLPADTRGRIALLQSSLAEDSPDEARELDLPAPPKESSPSKAQLISSLAPTLAMSVIPGLLIGRGSRLIIAALVGPLVAVPLAYLLMTLYHRRKHAKQLEAYEAQRSAALAGAGVRAGDEAVWQRRRSCDPALAIALATRRLVGLWGRRAESGLVLRLGAGTAPMTWLRARSAEDREALPSLHDVPIQVDLADVGCLVVTGPGEAAHGVARSLLLQLATQFSPDVGIGFVPSGAPVAAAFPYAQWLPHGAHLQDNGSIGALAALAALVDARVEAQRGHRRQDDERVVVLLDDYGDLALHGSSRSVVARLVEEGPAVGVHLVLVDSGGTAIPPAVTARLDCSTDGTGVLRIHGRPKLELLLDALEPDLFGEAVRSLAPLAPVVGDEEAALPDAVDLVDLLDLHPDRVAQQLAMRWTDTEQTAIPVAVGPDGPVHFDLATHPNAALVGVPGAGKTVTAVTMLLAAALINRPDQLQFAILAFKGAGDFMEIRRLPHCAGVVSNRDGAQADRMLTLLGAEIDRRQDLFEPYGGSLRAYHEACRADPSLPTCPRTLVLVDESAKLAADDSSGERMKYLSQLVTQGRSLGMHLVVATQTPNRGFTTDMRDNLAGKMALRLGDAAAAQSLVGSDLPARLPRHPHGRIVTVFDKRVLAQAAVVRPGHSRPPRLSVEADTSLAPTALTDVAFNAGVRRLVDEAQAAADSLATWRRPTTWLHQPLPDSVPVPAEGPGGTAAVVGRVDEPAAGHQGDLVFDAAERESWAVLGSDQVERAAAVAGFVLAAASQLPPEALEVHVIDHAGTLGALRKLPHTARYTSGADAQGTAAHYQELLADVARRNELVTRRQAVDLADLRDLAGGAAEPFVLLVCDDLPGLFEARKELFGLAAPDRDMRPLLAAGPRAGLRVLAGGGTRLGGSGELAAQFRRKAVLALDGGETAYQNIGLRVPAAGRRPLGRALLSRTQEAQLVLAPSRAADVQSVTEHVLERWGPGPSRRPDPGVSATIAPPPAAPAPVARSEGGGDVEDGGVTLVFGSQRLRFSPGEVLLVCGEDAQVAQALARLRGPAGDAAFVTEVGDAARAAYDDRVVIAGVAASRSSGLLSEQVRSWVEGAVRLVVPPLTSTARAWLPLESAQALEGNGSSGAAYLVTGDDAHEVPWA